MEHWPLTGAILADAFASRNRWLALSKTPDPLNALDAYILQPIVDYIYEGEHHPVYWVQDQYIEYGRSVMKPEDRWFTYRPE